MESEQKMDRRSLAINAAREAESMTSGVRIIKKFNIGERRVESEQADPEIHFQEVWPYLTEARWKELCHLVFREDKFRSRAALIERCKSEPLLDAALRPVALGGVEPLAGHALGEVGLAREAVLGVGVVGVALAVADVLHQAGGRVEDVLGRHQRAAAFCCLSSGAKAVALSRITCATPAQSGSCAGVIRSRLCK